MSELWFVYDAIEGDYNTFESEVVARNAFEATYRKYKLDAEYCGEYFSDVDVQFGKVHQRAELLDVEPEPDCSDECVVMIVTDFETDIVVRVE